MNCERCGEPITERERLCDPSPFVSQRHRECVLRSILGGANHIRRLCSCFGGTADPDPPGLSRREAAREAVRARGITRGDDGTQN